MGVDVANAGIRGHGKGTSPTTGDIELWCHWEDESIDEATTVTAEERDDLIADAVTSQSAFDSTAGSLASWYSFSGLTSAKRDAARAACRRGCSLMA
jgi:hypothetical protein